MFNLRDMQPADYGVEKFCNAVAAEFLIPKENLKGCWPDAKKTNEPFQFISLYFKVSPLAAARRALDLGYIDKTTFFEFYNRYVKDERRKAH